MEAEINRLKKLETNELDRMKLQNEELRNQMDSVYQEQRQLILDNENLRTKILTLEDTKQRLEVELQLSKNQENERVQSLVQQLISKQEELETVTRS